MPECNFFSKHLSCTNGDDCLYLHVDPETKRPPCPHYERGFCPLGPHCANKHVRKERICPFYLAGFCPNGRSCTEGAHPKFAVELEKPQPRVFKSPEEIERERMERDEERMREEERERERDGQQGGQVGGQQRWNKAGGGGWQQRKKIKGGRRKY